MKWRFILVLMVLMASLLMAYSAYADIPTSFKEPLTGMDFVLIKGGCYEMGDASDDGMRKDGTNREQPVHKVCIDDFYMGVHEVTQGQWIRLMKSNPSRFTLGDSYPVEKVNAKDIRDFISLLNEKTGKHHRLPTEAEWEYAAREGGKRIRFGTGSDTISPETANFNAVPELKKSYSTAGEFRKQTLPVGSFRPNALGLYDMAGNVWEWVSDWYDGTYYAASPRNNPKGPETGAMRIVRGGAWSCKPEDLRTTARSIISPDYRFYNIGFRLVLPIEQ